jgi:hypothetical protein
VDVAVRRRMLSLLEGLRIKGLEERRRMKLPLTEMIGWRGEGWQRRRRWWSNGFYGKGVRFTIA